MASKTALPIARLRALGCRIGTVPGHWPTAPRRPSWQYSLTLPKGIEVPVSSRYGMLDGTASAHVTRDGRIVVRAFSPGDVTKDQRERIESSVAGLLDKIADKLNGR